MIPCGNQVRHHNKAHISKNRCLKCNAPLYNDIDQDGNHLGMICLNGNCIMGPHLVYASGKLVGKQHPKVQKFPKEMVHNDWQS